MVVEGAVIATSLKGLWYVAQFGLVILVALYFVFSLIVVQQVKVMTDTFVTELAPFLRFLSVLHAGIALGIVILFIGLTLT